MSTKILCVDDDANILAGFQRNLRKQFAIDTALGGAAALEAIERSGPYAVVVVDMQMPGMNGVTLLGKIQQISPDTVRIMLTGNADQQTAVLAVNQGHVFQFLTKPCDADTLALTLQAGLKQYALITAEKELLERTLNGVIQTLTEILSTMDPCSFGHSQKLREYMKGFVQTYKTPNSWALEMAAMLCPIGFVAVPPLVLQNLRSGKTLFGPEKDMVTRVPQVGADLIAGIPRLEQVALNILYQAKNFDGSGFPVDNLAGESIPVGARILHVLYDLVRKEDRGVTRIRAIESMQKQRGAYDPAVLEAVANHFDIYLDKPSPEAPSVREVPMSELQVGMLLMSDIRNNEDILLIRSGTRITPMLMERLVNFQQIGGVSGSILVAN